MAGKIQPLANKSKQTKVEEAKKNSHHLRGTIPDVLANPEAPSFAHDDMQLLKFHGIYQQEDRDARPASKALGVDNGTSFMLRLKVPGGTLTADQYLAMHHLAEEVTYNNSLRITTRQTLQFHGILKGQLKDVIKTAHNALMSSLGGCGDVMRNVMAPPAPIANDGHPAATALANEIATGLCPKTNAYFEVWMDGEKVDTTQEQEPLYGEQYLPRKFKIGIALPNDNSTDVHSQDVGLIAVLNDQHQIERVNVLVGGGLGMTHKKEETYARLGTPLGSVEPGQVVQTIAAVAEIFRDCGDRTDRKHARLKFIVEEHGIDAFREEVEARAGFKVQPWVEVGDLEHPEWLGAHEQGDGKFLYGLHVPNGRIIDRDVERTKTAVARIVENIRPRIILTPDQNLIFGDLDQDQVKAVETVLKAYNIPHVDTLSTLRRFALACPALPTCGLALTESERIMPEVVDELEASLDELGANDVPMTVRMTGCPNGCARPYTADIGLVGHKPGHYDVFLGGRVQGDRVAELFAENVQIDQLKQTLAPVFKAYASQRKAGESLGDFYQRVLGADRRFDIVTGSKESPAQPRVEQRLVQLSVSV